MRTVVLSALVLAGMVSGCGPAIGSRVVTPATESVVVRARGGELPASPKGVDCSDHTALYALDRKTHELAWDFCFVQQHGKRVLAGEELRTLEQTLAELEVVRSEHLCAPDAVEVLVTTTGSRSVTYRNDLCADEPPVLDNGAVGRLLKLLATLAGV